jgi:lambda family phage portal protein
MIGPLLDSFVAALSPQAGLNRKRARAALKRAYSGAEPNRLTTGRNPHNRPADIELLGPNGAARTRALARDLVRNNAYAWGVVDTIVSSVVGTGIKVQSAMETQDGEDIETANEMRDKVFHEWCRVAELTGQYSFYELQGIVQREMVEAGECLVHIVSVPTDFRGIRRPVPLALELIEADRLASDRDTYQLRGGEGNRIVGGIELDDVGTPVAYWVYPAHPQDHYSVQLTPVRIKAERIVHLYRKDRIGQHRGASWFAPVIGWMRDLGLYVENEMVAGAVSACYAVAITSETPIAGLNPPSTADAYDANGNRFDYVEPGSVMHLAPGEDIKNINPSRPNSNAEPWINLMLRAIAVGTGLSYEIVARDFSQTNYSSNRASQLEDRRRFRRWQRYLIDHLCDPVWAHFCRAAALTGNVWFPSLQELSEDRDRFAPADFMPPSWEWVDPDAEQKSSQNAITAFQATYADELGAKGLNWRHVFYQRAKEERLLEKLGLSSPTAQKAALAAAQQANNAIAQGMAGGGSEAEPTAGAEVQSEAPQATGEMMGLSTLQWNRNRKAIAKVLNELTEGTSTETQARVLLASLGMSQESIDALIADATDGTPAVLPEAVPDAT